MAKIISIKNTSLKNENLLGYIENHQVFILNTSSQKLSDKEIAVFCPSKHEKQVIESLGEDILTIKEASSRYPILASNKAEKFSFSSNGITFGQDSFHIIAGLNSVDNIANIEKVFMTLNSLNITTARMGAYKPRTSPYSFQGVGQECLKDIFSLADKYAVSLISIEVRSEKELDELLSIHTSGNYTAKPIIQVGTRNAQNFELLKQIGKATKFPILYKRGFGTTIEESMSACEYLAANGNDNIIFCLRGIKSFDNSEHRNLSDFSQISIIKRNLKIPVCVDPSHSVGQKLKDNNGIYDISNICAQGVISGTNALLIDIHPTPEQALVDSQQTLNLNEFEQLVYDIRLTRECYIKRQRLYQTSTIKDEMFVY